MKKLILETGYPLKHKNVTSYFSWPLLTDILEQKAYAEALGEIISVADKNERNSYAEFRLEGG